MSAQGGGRSLLGPPLNPPLLLTVLIIIAIKFVRHNWTTVTVGVQFDTVVYDDSIQCVTFYRTEEMLKRY